SNMDAPKSVMPVTVDDMLKRVQLPRSKLIVSTKTPAEGLTLSTTGFINVPSPPGVDENTPASSVTACAPVANASTPAVKQPTTEALNFAVDLMMRSL